MSLPSLPNFFRHSLNSWNHRCLVAATLRPITRWSLQGLLETGSKNGLRMESFERYENSMRHHKVPNMADVCVSWLSSIIALDIIGLIPIVNRNLQKQLKNQFPYWKVEHKDLDGLCLFTGNSQKWDHTIVTGHIIEQILLWNEGSLKVFEWLSLTSLGMSNHPHTVKYSES